MGQAHALESGGEVTKKKCFQVDTKDTGHNRPDWPKDDDFFDYDVDHFYKTVGCAEETDCFSMVSR